MRSPHGLKVRRYTSKTLTAAPTNQKSLKYGNTTVGVAEATIITGVKPVPPINPAIKFRHSTRRDWTGAIKRANDG